MSYRSYWDRRASLCSEFADEGECLAQVAKHVPVTIGSYSQLGCAPCGMNGLGDTGQDVARATQIIAGLIANPDATLRTHGPAIVVAADRHVVEPLTDKIGENLAPYAVKYILPPLAVLYIISGIGAFYSYKAATGGIKRNPRRRRRRTSRR
jgi:hypothetical protein